MKTLHEIIDLSLNKVNPLLPLKSWVAVNPFQGLAHLPFEEAASHLHALAQIDLTMPLSFYEEQLKNGKISQNELSKVVRKSGKYASMKDFMHAVKITEDLPEHSTLYTYIDFVDHLAKKDLIPFFTKRISTWAASYFDAGHATWKTGFGQMELFESWKLETLSDYSYKIKGLQNFTEAIAILPQKETQRIELALKSLKIEGEKNIELYFDRLLKLVPGWTAYIANLDREAQLKGQVSNQLRSFLSILTSIDLGLFFSNIDAHIEQQWTANASKLNVQFEKNQDLPALQLRLLLHTAYEQTRRKQLVQTINNAPKTTKDKSAPLAQVAFCIDVRSEIIRRNLEQVQPYIQTLGYAGFFGFPFQLSEPKKAQPAIQSPALLFPALRVKKSLTPETEASMWTTFKDALFSTEAATYAFKKNPLTGFGYVSPRGLYKVIPTLQALLPKLQSSKKHPSAHGNREEYKIADLPISDLASTAENALRGMGLSKINSKYVVLIGHGSTSRNNPMAAGLNCGACGGNTGEANARVAAQVLNRPEVQMELRHRGIEIPAETRFLAGIHDTTTDEITLTNVHEFADLDTQELKVLERAFAQAGSFTRLERATALNLNTQEPLLPQFLRKSADWSEIRPEWGLSKCSDFIIADRAMVKHANLEGTAFLHEYNRFKDPDNRILEQIMTAPMVVTSWINLQYYASTVDPKSYGSGYKTLHNVTAGNVIIEGASGDIKMGLPMESVHNGQDFYHQPHKLNIIIAAEPDNINAILEKHTLLRDLFNHGWLSLMSMNDLGKIDAVYRGDFAWESIHEMKEAVLNG